MAIGSRPARCTAGRPNVVPLHLDQSEAHPGRSVSLTKGVAASSRISRNLGSHAELAQLLAAQAVAPAVIDLRLRDPAPQRTLSDPEVLRDCPERLYRSRGNRTASQRNSGASDLPFTVSTPFPDALRPFSGCYRMALNSSVDRSDTVSRKEQLPIGCTRLIVLMIVATAIAMAQSELASGKVYVPRRAKPRCGAHATRHAALRRSTHASRQGSRHRTQDGCHTVRLVLRRRKVGGSTPERSPAPATSSAVTATVATAPGQSPGEQAVPTAPGQSPGEQAVPTAPGESPGEQMTWRPVGSLPLSDAEAAARVIRRPEQRPDNVAANDYVPTNEELAAFHSAAKEFSPLSVYVDGRDGLTDPSTDDLIQWASLKWGIPTDWLRAEYVMESDWRQSNLGDLAQVSPEWWAQYPAVAQRASDEVYESMGITQIKWKPTDEDPGTEPLRWKSTAFNVDYQASVVRYYYDGYCRWCSAGYGSGQQWNSIGAWYEPSPWDNAGAQAYVASVQTILSEKPWLLPSF